MIWPLTAGFALTAVISTYLMWRHRNTRVHTSTSDDRTLPPMQPCPVCGKIIAADWEFCPFCGRVKPRAQESS
jgi:ribosomal protein L32